MILILQKQDFLKIFNHPSSAITHIFQTRTSLHIPAGCWTCGKLYRPNGSLFAPVLFDVNLEVDIPKIMVSKKYLVSKVFICQIPEDV